MLSEFAHSTLNEIAPVMSYGSTCVTGIDIASLCLSQLFACHELM